MYKDKICAKCGGEFTKTTAGEALTLNDRFPNHCKVCGSHEFKIVSVSQWFDKFIGTIFELTWNNNGKSGIDRLTLRADGAMIDRGENVMFRLPADDPGVSIKNCVEELYAEDEGNE